MVGPVGATMAGALAEGAAEGTGVTGAVSAPESHAAAVNRNAAFT